MILFFGTVRNCSRNNMVQLQDDNKLSVGGAAFLLSAPVRKFSDEINRIKLMLTVRYMQKAPLASVPFQKMMKMIMTMKMP